MTLCRWKESQSRRGDEKEETDRVGTEGKGEGHKREVEALRFETNFKG